MTDELDLQIQAYEDMKDELLKHYDGKYVVFHHQKFSGAYDNFENAVKCAISQFGRGPYLIRQVKKENPSFHMPASVAYRTDNAHY